MLLVAKWCNTWWSETTSVCFSHSIHPHINSLGAWSINTTQNLILQVPHNALQISSIHIFQGIIFIILCPVHHKLHEFPIAWTQQCRCHGRRSNGWSWNFVRRRYQVTTPWPRYWWLNKAMTGWGCELKSHYLHLFTRFLTSHGGSPDFLEASTSRILSKYVCFFHRMIKRQRNNIVVSKSFKETHGLPLFHTHVPEISKNRVIFDWSLIFELGLCAMEAPSSKKSLDPLCHAWSWVDRKNEAMHGSFCLWKIPWKFLDQIMCFENAAKAVFFGNWPFTVPENFRCCCWISMNYNEFISYSIDFNEWIWSYFTKL